MADGGFGQFGLALVCLGMLLGLSVLVGASKTWPNDAPNDAPAGGPARKDGFSDVPAPPRGAPYKDIFPSVVDRGHDYRNAIRMLSAEPVDGSSSLRAAGVLGTTENFTSVPLKSLDERTQPQPDGWTDDADATGEPGEPGEPEEPGEQ